MADVHSISISKVEPLTGDNYHVWALKVSSILRSRKLFKAVIEDPEPTISADTDSVEAKARETWEGKNDEAFGIIIITLSPDQAGLFIGERKAKTVWEELKRIHAGNVEDRRIDIGLELKNIRMSNTESVDSFITRARNIASRSAALGQVIPSREIVHHVVRGLHPKMENIAAVLRPQRSATLEEVQQSLREEETRLNLRNGLNFNQSKSERAYKAKDGKDRYSKSDRKCFVCGKAGHLARDCWHRQHKDEISEKQTRAENYSRGGQTFRGRRKERQKEHAGIASRYKSEHAFESCTEPLHQVFAMKDKGQSNLWSLDSGCTSHMSPRKDWMVDMKPFYSEINVAEEERSVQAEAKGNVQISTTTSDGEKKDICIQDVLYVPKLRTNLLSVNSLIDKGNRILFDREGGKIYNQHDELLAEAFERDRMFVLETKPRSESSKAVASCLTAEFKKMQNLTEMQTENVRSESLNSGNENSDNSDKATWHRRLGHINEDYMDRMKRNEIVKGLNYEPLSLGICEPCVMGKLVQKPFKSVDIETTSRPLELIHMDLCGPMPNKSLGGAKYMHVLVDSFSRRHFVFFLKSKDEAFDCFTEFKNQRENELNTKMKSVRSDNGTEFVNSRFQELFKEEGIRHQKTVPYTPQSNGVAERANRTLLDKARTMLIDAELPARFWAEAVATAAYLKNCSPTKNDSAKTPMEKWNGRIPSISHLKVFGCVAYYHIAKHQRNKLEPRASKGILVGYSQKRRAYRIFDPITRDIQEVRTAKFDENSKGAKLLTRENLNEPIEDLKYIQVNSETEETRRNNLQVNEQTLPDEIDEWPVLRMDQSLQDDAVPDYPPENDPVPDQQFHDQAEQRRPGRNTGDSNEMIRARRQIELMEREERQVREGARRSERLRPGHQVNVSIEKNDAIPTTYAEVLKSPYSENWRAAMMEEIQSLNTHEVWKLKPRTTDMKVIKSKWVFNTKENPDGTINRRKARLVAVGCNQRPGVDYEQSFSPVMKLESFRTIVALASQLKLKVRQYDVKAAYLYGDLNEKIYMEQPEGFIQKGNEDQVCELQRSLYGLPQSGRCWNEKLNQVLTNIGLRRLETDPCVYIFQRKGKLFLMGIYVDDTLVAGTDDDIIDEMMTKVKEHFEMTEYRGSGCFLGIVIEETPEGFELSQQKYVNKILERFGLAGCNPVKTPGDPHQDLDKYQESTAVNEREYQEMIGSLMYLSVGTRPDITFSVSQLSQYNQDPRKIHLTAVKRVYRYLQGTMDYKLAYTREEGKVEASTDASWCSTREAKSFSGYTIKLGSSLISWKTRKQNLVALSTCEAELMAICEGVRELKWITSFLSELGMQEYVKPPQILKTDSKSAIDWIKSNAQQARTKHINRKYYFVRDEVQKGNIEIEFVRSEDMEADILTKSLSAEKIQECNKKLGLMNHAVCEEETLTRKGGIVATDPGC